MRLDQPLQLEPRQRLAQRNIADPQLLGQRILTERAVRRHPPRQDAVADQIDELIGQRPYDQRTARIMSIKLPSSSATGRRKLTIPYPLICRAHHSILHPPPPHLGFAAFLPYTV